MIGQPVNFVVSATAPNTGSPKNMPAAEKEPGPCILSGAPEKKASPFLIWRAHPLSVAFTTQACLLAGVWGRETEVNTCPSWESQAVDGVGGS